MNNNEENRIDEAERITQEVADAWRIKQDTAEAPAPARADAVQRRVERTDDQEMVDD
jgi:hypothetical protein